MTKLVTFGLLCAAALLVAAYSHKDRHCLLVAAAVLCVNWLLFSMPWIYNLASLAHLLRGVGVPASHEDMWSFADLVSIVVLTFWTRRVWWSRIVVAGYMITLAMLAVAAYMRLDYDQYQMVLDTALVVQLAVVFTLGGGGFADRMLAYWSCHRVRLLGRGSMAHEKAP